MKLTFYPSILSGKRLITLFLAALLISGITADAQTYTITFPNAPPAVNDPSLNQNDNGGTIGIEVGVKFRVTQIGEVTHIRFYKGDGVLGTHTGSLWTESGTNLGSALFSESASGWQEVALPAPVTVTPGNIYVASVFSNFGDYGSENDTWAGGTDYGTNPIKVIAWLNAPPAGNGVYKYVNAPTFPDQDGTADNYWVDLRFDPTFTLPVEISDLKATTNSSDVLVSWKTSSETNNRGFEVQRSNNGTDWYPLTFINGAGESTVIRNYSYTDKSLAPGTYYYRLKQSDFDGKHTFSSVISAVVAGKGKVSLFPNYPNPFTSTSTIRFDLPQKQHVRLSIFDVTGREIKVLTDKIGEAGSHIVTLDAANLSRQIYIVRLRTDNGVLTQRILVQ